MSIYLESLASLFFKAHWAISVYCFGLQEPDCSKVKTYPRQLEGVIREADTRRARARASRKQRKQEERDKMEAGIQRLKTLKRQEIESR